MKKIYTDWIYKQKHKRKSAKLWRRRLKSKNKHTQQFISKKGLSVRYGAQVSQHYSKVLTAPSNFCIKENPNEVVRFINRLNKYNRANEMCTFYKRNVQKKDFFSRQTKSV